MARRETRKAGILGDLERLSVTMEANEEQLPQLESFRLKFEGIVPQSLDVSQQQAVFQASKQEASKQLRRLLPVSDHFGPPEEKVTEFGVQPFRGRKVKTPTGTPSTPPAALGSASPVKSDR